LKDSERRLSAVTAIVPEEKLRDYVLSPTHPDGKAKADYLARIGYSQERWQQLEGDLRIQHLILEAKPGRVTPWGRKYEILGPLIGPNGGTAWVRTIWIVRHGESAARLITLIPAREP